MRYESLVTYLYTLCFHARFRILLPLMPFVRFCQVRLMSRFVDVSFNVYIVVWMYCIDSMLASLGGNDSSTHTIGS